MDAREDQLAASYRLRVMRETSDLASSTLPGRETLSPLRPCIGATASRVCGPPVLGVRAAGAGAASSGHPGFVCRVSGESRE